MTDINYELPEDPVYKTQIRKLQNDDPVNAETIINPLMEDVLENIHAVKMEQDEYKREIEDDLDIKINTRMPKMPASWYSNTTSANSYFHIANFQIGISNNNINIPFTYKHNNTGVANRLGRGIFSARMSSSGVSSCNLVIINKFLEYIEDLITVIWKVEGSIASFDFYGRSAAAYNGMRLDFEYPYTI